MYASNDAPQNCYEWQSPSIQQVVEELTDVERILISMSGMFTLATLILFALHLYTLSTSPARSRTITRTSFLVSFMPVTAVCSFIGLLIPRAEPMVSVMINAAFARWLFGFVEYIAVDVYGDRARMKYELRHVYVPLNYAPLTCCLDRCLPRPKATGAVLSRLEWLIWQNGIVRCVLSFCVGLLNANRHGAELAGDVWVTTLSAMGIFSTLAAMWALNAYSHVVAAPLAMYRAQLQFRLVQVMTVLMNFQGNLFILLSGVNVLQCTHNMNPFTFARLLNFFCLICEMLLISVCVCTFLRRAHNALLRGESKGDSADASSVGGHSIESDILATHAPDICVVAATPPPPAYTHAYSVA